MARMIPAMSTVSSALPISFIASDLILGVFAAGLVVPRLARRHSLQQKYFPHPQSHRFGRKAAILYPRRNIAGDDSGCGDLGALPDGDVVVHPHPRAEHHEILKRH